MTASTAPDYTSRLQKVREAIREPELDGLLILGPANRRYLSGYTAADGAIGESSGAVLVTQDRAALLVPAMYLEQARQESVLEPVGLKRRNPKLVTEILAEWGIRRLGFEKDFTVYSYYERLKENLSEGGEMIPVGGIVEELRRRKDPAEQQTMRDAARIADEAFTSVLSTIEPGVTERHMARSIDARMLELGADLPAFETIVAAGTNSARPHHEPGSTVIRAGDPVIVDMGARYNGYCSDMTRSFCLGRADDRYIQLHSIVQIGRAHV